jgi:hypothetical protein
MSEVKGKLIVKMETKEYGSNGFRKREFVIKTEDSQYPQEIIIELIQDKCDLLDKFNLEDNLNISYNLNGRSWVNPQGETKYFNSIQGWRIDKAQPDATAINNATAMVDNKFEPASDFDNDDTPF